MTGRLSPLCILILLGPTAVAQDGHHEEPPPVQQGGHAPSFGPLRVLNARAAGSREISFAAGQSAEPQAWVVSFMAGWCPGCVNELPMMTKLDDAYRGRGVQVLSVSIDDKAKAASVEKLLTENHVRFPVAIDADHKVLQQYQGPHRTSLPFLMVIDKAGVVRLLDEGYSAATEGEVRAVLDSLLAR
jgi:peroxiredoxin